MPQRSLHFTCCRPGPSFLIHFPLFRWQSDFLPFCQCHFNGSHSIHQTVFLPLRNPLSIASTYSFSLPAFAFIWCFLKKTLLSLFMFRGRKVLFWYFFHFHISGVNVSALFQDALDDDISALHWFISSEQDVKDSWAQWPKDTGSQYLLTRQKH